MRGSAPLRFLAVAIGGWAALRVATVAPPWRAPPIAPAAAAGPVLAAQARRSAEPAPAPGGPSRARSPARAGSRAQARPPSLRLPQRPVPVPPPGAGLGHAEIAAALPSPPVPRRVAPRPSPPSGASAGRWSLSAWAFVRSGGAAALAAGGLLGGSQAGARLAYRLNRGGDRPIALSARLSAPLRRHGGGEAAVGLDWRPIRGLPVHLLAERRQRLGGEGRSAFALTAHGGVAEVALGPLRLDSWLQAGAVGVRSRDLFADGSARLSLPLGRDVRVGAGAWAAVQPGLARLDLGPQASLRLPVPGRSVTLAADWRVRAAGNARPGSGPTLTLATDF